MRDGRCEGVYIKQVSIASFTRIFENYNFSIQNPLIINWQLPSQEHSIRLRTKGLKRKLYYQMDSHCQSGENSFIWPIDLLQQKDISKSALGLVGWTEIHIDGKKEEVLLLFNYRYYPSGRGIEVTLPLVDKSGIYLLEIASIIASSGSTVS